MLIALYVVKYGTRVVREGVVGARSKNIAKKPTR